MTTEKFIYQGHPAKLTTEDREIENRHRYAPARHAARVANFSSCVHGGPRVRPIRARRAVSCSEERWSALEALSSNSLSLMVRTARARRLQASTRASRKSSPSAVWMRGWDARMRARAGSGFADDASRPHARSSHPGPRTPRMRSAGGQGESVGFGANRIDKGT